MVGAGAGPEPVAHLSATPRNLNWNQGRPQMRAGHLASLGRASGIWAKKEKNGAMAKEEDGTLKLGRKRNLYKHR